MQRAALHILSRADEWLAGALLVAVMAITGYNVVNRYLLQQSAVWAPELAGFLFTWVVFLGASAAARRGMHVSVGVFVDRLGPSARRWVVVAGEIVLLAFLAYTLWLAIRITGSSYSRLSPVMRIPFSFVYASVVAGFSLMLARSLLVLWRELKGEPLPRED